MSLKEDRSYAARVARAQGMGLQRQNADLFATKKEINERKAEKRIAAKKKAFTRKPTGRYFLNRETTGRGSKKRRRKSRKTKRRRKSRNQTAGMEPGWTRPDRDTEPSYPGARRDEWMDEVYYSDEEPDSPAEDPGIRARLDSIRGQVRREADHEREMREMARRRERPQGWRARTSYDGLGEKYGWVAYDHHDIYDGSWRGLVPTDEACCSTCRKTLCDTLTCKRNAIKKCYKCDYNPDTNSWHANNDSRQCMTNNEKYNARFPSARGSRKKRKKRNTKKTRGSTQHKVKASTMRKHSKKHSKRHINHMKKMMKKGYSFKKAHRSAMRKVGK